MPRKCDQALGVEADLLGQHPVDGPAQRGGGLIVVGCAAGQPALHEDTAHAVARLDAGDAGADRRHFARAIRKRGQRRFYRSPIAAFRNHQIAEVEGTGANPDHSLSRPRHRLRKFNHSQVFEAKRLHKTPCSQGRFLLFLLPSDDIL